MTFKRTRMDQGETCNPTLNLLLKSSDEDMNSLDEAFEESNDDPDYLPSSELCAFPCDVMEEIEEADVSFDVEDNMNEDFAVQRSRTVQTLTEYNRKFEFLPKSAESMPRNISAFDILRCFIDDDLMNSIITSTNMYATRNEISVNEGSVLVSKGDTSSLGAVI
eukprot:GAHX01006447.1.p1 GENE.GAHX01006447.1~~GAHX01006447.1.p1  ORF type:complete len:164 (+),score=26.16 GAHX01006447.1:42-533(+)